MEVGIQSGGSVEVVSNIGPWHVCTELSHIFKCITCRYFGDKLHYYGVDINPYTKELFADPPNTHIFVGADCYLHILQIGVIHVRCTLHNLTILTPNS